jgi:hypothetical protein
MRKMKLNLLIGLLAFLAISCGKAKNDCYEEKYTSAFIVNAPDSLAVGELFLLEINFLVENSCGEFNRIEATKVDNTIEGRLITVYEDCNCDEEFEEKETQYPIQFDEVGEYQLKFWVAENEFDVYNLSVYE